MSNIDINTRILVGEEGAPKQLKKFCSLSYRYASSFLTTWLQLQFSFSQHRVPYANCYSEMTLIPQVCSRDAIFNSAVRWKYVLDKLKEAASRWLQSRIYIWGFWGGWQVTAAALLNLGLSGSCSLSFQVELEKSHSAVFGIQHLDYLGRNF